ncbi:MAG TPA: hypothetical protein VJ762_07025, partial [Sphingobium sp.]|nr:hypothetical protein [Sphingobium sp.]
MKNPWLPSVRLSLVALAACLSSAGTRAAEPAPFDLPGPDLSVSVTRGGRTLPIGQVPALATGDLIRIEANLP